MSGRAGIIAYFSCLLIAIAALVAEIAGHGAVHKLISSPGPSCPIEQSGSKLGYVAPRCRVLASDTAADPDAHHLWGARYGCASDDRVADLPSGGDPRPTAVGTPQGNSSFRRLTVLDGDDYSGERCELGYNTWNAGQASPANPYGTFYNYYEGFRRTTYFSVRLPDNFPLGATSWQGIGQMKQSGGSDGSAGTPVLSFSAYNGVWSFWHTYPNDLSQDFELWWVPAQKNVWTRIAVDAYYSQFVDRGWIRYYVDANGDGDFRDRRERSPVFHTNTLKREIPGTTDDGLAAGDSIPSHLRMGIYHASSIPCPRPAGCSLDIDNVQVLEP
jgi:polysaccharide lyase-like protein